MCDKYLSRGKMYPGGQCVNTCVYAQLTGAQAAYLGKYGSDEVAAYNRSLLRQLGIDDSRSRQFEGENGFAMVTLKGNDRVFLVPTKAASPKSTGFDFTAEDLDYIRQFQLIYTNLNSYIEDGLPFLQSSACPSPTTSPPAGPTNIWPGWRPMCRWPSSPAPI